jgi:hypothetical protein
MKYRLLCSGIFAAILTASTGALAQSPAISGGTGVSPAAPPALLAPLPMGNNTSGVNQPGVPNTSTTGLIGTGTTSSGLPGESTHHPGFPGRHPK